MFTAFLILCLIAGFMMINSSTSSQVYANYAPVMPELNQPMGQGQGIFPGRVVWVHDADATNEQLTNAQICNGDGWYKEDHNDQTIIDEMLNQALKEITGETNIISAWNKIFQYNNASRGKGEISYQPDEIIFIKINRTSAWGMGGWGGNINNDFSRAQNIYFGTSETSPQLILSLLRHLINHLEIPQSNIYIGDPMKHIYQHDMELWSSEFPDIHYLDHHRTDSGREAVETGDSLIYYSDRGKVLRTGSWSNMADGDPVYQDHFYKIFETCDYLINVPTLKGHRRGGITMFAKNHFGSHVRENAIHLHMGLICPDEPNVHVVNERHEYGVYRVLVDLMGWELIRKKSLIYLMDALWSAGHEVIQPSKWKTAPFNNDWSSSIFISQDPVAIESVGYDFLRNEYTPERHPNLTLVQMEGVDDYLHQAADSTNWPQDIVYDPENDGTPLPSLGVHEHWNNPVEKAYTQNLGTGEGIELIARDASNDTQDDTVFIYHTTDLPIIDGIGNDPCWEKAQWQEIGQTWMPYQKFILSDDFSGRYKCIWNYDENRLYFLVEIKDDILVDGYEIGQSGYHHYDLVELFIDEDNSGGPHIFDSENSNAENAFAYHMNVNYPAVGDTVHDFLAMDMTGYSWNNMSNPDYSNSHFPEHVLRRTAVNKYTREFSLNLYKDTYNNNNPENSRSPLTANKIIGLSMAYCDNDDIDESPKQRDNFFGSVEVAHADSNSHWENADGFGVAKLIDTTGYVAIDNQETKEASAFHLAQNYPNPFNPTTTISYSLPKNVNVNLTVYNITGQKVAELINEYQTAGQHRVQWNAGNFASGIYYYKLTAGKFSTAKRCLLMK